MRPHRHARPGQRTLQCNLQMHRVRVHRTLDVIFNHALQLRNVQQVLQLIQQGTTTWPAGRG